MARLQGTFLVLLAGLASPSLAMAVESETVAFHQSPSFEYSPAPALGLFQDGDGATPTAEEERSRRELMGEMTSVLVEQYMANARAFEEQLELELALRELNKARDLDPADTIVLDYERQLQALLKMPEAEAALLRVSARDRYEAQRQQLKMLARIDLDNARQAMAAGEYENAVSLARGVSNSIRWSQGEVSWGDLSTQVDELLAKAEDAASGADAARQEDKKRQAYEALRSEEKGREKQEELRIQSLLINATSAFDRADYETTEKLAQAVLDVDRHNAHALELLDAAQDASREYADRIFIQTRREEFNRWRNNMEEVRIPNAELYTDPDPSHWAKITASRGLRRSLGLGDLDPEIAALNDLLDSTRMDAEFDDKTIVEVANHLSFVYDIPVSIDPEVAIDLDDNADYVNITGLQDITARSFMNVLVEQVGDDLAWTIRNGRVYVTQQEKAGGKPITRVHPIQDLTFELTNFKGNDIRDIALPGEAGDDNEETIFNSELETVELIEGEEILNLVRENITPELWDLSDAYNIDFVDNGNLLVIHTPEVQAQVAEFLDDLRAFSTSMVTLESRFFSISDLFIEEIGTDLRGLDPQGAFANEYELDAADQNGDISQGLDNLGDGTNTGTAGGFYEDGDQIYALHSENFFSNPLGALMSTVGGGAFEFQILDDVDLNIVMNLVSKSENAVEITAPVISVYNTQRAFVTVVNQVSFVQDFEVDVATNAFIADPVIGIAQEGIVLDVKPTISYDRKYITLDVQTTVAELERPFPTISTLLGPNGSPVTFSVPTLRVQDAQTTVVVPDGGAVILGGFKHVRYKNRTAESPWFSDIPVVGFFFREKGLADEVTDLIIVIRAKITDFSHLREPVAGR
jgi:type II secretory pathway component GspD/PulD (secretin)